MIQERVQALRNLMKERGIDIYLIPTADFHQSEYVGDYFKVREYLSGFTGSFGTLAVTQETAALWTDGRYFLQAEKELRDSKISLMKMGMEGVPEIEDYLVNEIPPDGCLGFDGRTVSEKAGRRLEVRLAAKNAAIFWQEDLADRIWTDRPALPRESAFLLDASYTGVTREEKISEVREDMKLAGATAQIFAGLDEIAWLLNLRGNDIAYNPVALAYAIVTQDAFELFIQKEAVTDEVRTELEKADVTLWPYQSIYESAAKFSPDDRILLDGDKTNYALACSLPSSCKMIFAESPVTVRKAIKTPIEIENMKLAQIKDGAAMCKFIYWLKQNVGKGTITELSAAAYAEKMRKADPDYLELSFSTIAAYGENAAMCHYHPTPQSDAKVKPEGFFLLDSGGQYWQGTTDVTRTISVGALTNEEKINFTLVLQGHIRLAMARFLYGCCGANLDYLARGPLWERGLDYNHGTGHGVGYLLNVHEGPNNIRWRVDGGATGTARLEEGMVTSNEPGFYEEGEYGIRTENLIVCKKAEKTKYGQFMEFETITLVPIDREGILPDMLEEKELQWLNDYHKKVYDLVGVHVNEEVREWLEEVTRPIRD